MSMSKIFTLILTIATSISLISCAQKVQQFDPSRLDNSIRENDFTLVYFYSSSCQYCKQFTPKFQQVAKNDKVRGVNYGKIDGPAYKNLTQKYDVFSYPSILLFWKNIDMPIAYTKQREVIQLQEFIDTNTKVFQFVVKKQLIENLTQSARQSGILYVGDLNTFQLNVTSVLGFLQGYRRFAILQANVTQPYLVIKDKNYYDFDIRQLRNTIRKAFAKLHPISEQSWLRIHQKNEIGIVFADVKNNSQVTKIMEKLTVQYPDIVFLRMDPNHEQFRDALASLGVQKQQNIYGVHKRYDVKFQAQRPYTEQSLRQFVQDVINLKAKIFMRSEKTKKSTPQKLTLKNYEQKVKDSPTDVVIFLYKEQDQNHNKFMDIFRWITKKLKDNKNLSILRCNLSKNQIEAKLEFPVKITPSIVFFGHRMKDKPVHFVKSIVSAENVIEFIMENTTFDWEDQWGEL